MLLEAMIAVEDAEKAEERAQQELARLTSQWRADEQRLTEERRQLESEVAALTQRRTEMMAGIAQEYLEPYQRLRREHAGMAVARVEGEMCGGCGEEISDRALAKARISDNLSFCSNCNRILVID